MHYNATITLNRPAPDGPDDPWVDITIDTLVGLSPAISGDNRETRLVVTIPADDARQATVLAGAIAASVAPQASLIGLEVITTEEFDRRNGVPPMPDLLSVTQAADALGVTRQAVLQRIASGSLPAARVGEVWAIPASVVARAVG